MSVEGDVGGGEHAVEVICRATEGLDACGWATGGATVQASLAFRWCGGDGGKGGSVAASARVAMAGAADSITVSVMNPCTPHFAVTAVRCSATAEEPRGGLPRLGSTAGASPTAASPVHTACIFRPQGAGAKPTWTSVAQAFEAARILVTVEVR